MPMRDQIYTTLNKLSLVEIIQLQNHISKTLTQRFERNISLASSDIVGSTSYFARFGDEAGRRLQQLHFDLFAESINETQGQIVDNIGDGILMAFPTVESAIKSSLRFKQLLQQSNFQLSPDKHWTTRISIHWGKVLTDNITFTGDSVNLCAKICSTAQPGEIRLSKVAFNELPSIFRLACRTLRSKNLPRTSQSIEMVQFVWKDLLMIPSVVYIEETGLSFILPDQPVVSFGRLATFNGVKANDIILKLSDSSLTNQISRWHFELIQSTDGLVVHALSANATEVDGKLISQGNCVPLKIGSKVRIAGVLNLRFLAHMKSQNKIEKTVINIKSSQIYHSQI